MTPILEARGLVKRYGKVTTVHGIDIEVYPGEIVGLLGANGAGKTTSFHMICGLSKPSEGKIFLDGQEITRWSMTRRCRVGLGYLPQEHSLFGTLTVAQNLLGALEFYGTPKRQRRAKCEEVLKQFDLWEDPVKGPMFNRVVGYGGSGGLSGGERRRLEFARAVAGNPKILMLDEPFAACDPETISKIQNAVLRLADSGIAVLINDHAIANTLKITQRAYVIDRGRVLCSGSAMEVLCNPDAIHYYFTHEARDNAETIGRAHGTPPEQAREMVARAYEECEARWPDDVVSLSRRGSVPKPTDDDYVSPERAARNKNASSGRFPIGLRRRNQSAPTPRAQESALPKYNAIERDEERAQTQNRDFRNDRNLREDRGFSGERDASKRKSLTLRRSDGGETRTTPSPRDEVPEENRYADKTQNLFRRRRSD